MSSLSLTSVTAKQTLPRWLPLLLVFLLAAFLRHGVVVNNDVSWGLTMADKVLDGQHLYVDIVEVDPPAPVYLYMVPALLGRLSGLPEEFFVNLLLFVSVAASLWLAGRILRRAGIGLADGWTVAAAVAAALLILPFHIFGEREHFALIVFLPILAAAAVRARGATPDLKTVITAGFCGGIAAIIKPHFAIPIICTAAVAALHARSWRVFFAPENWIAAGLLAAYTAAVMIAYPQFITEMLPMAVASYLPVTSPLLLMLLDIATPLWLVAVLLTALVKRRAVSAPPFSLLLAASTGFMIAFFVQQKGWPYESYPMLALALIALVLAVIEQWQAQTPYLLLGQIKRVANIFSVLLLGGLAMAWFNLDVDPTALAAAVRTIKPHPKIMSLSTYLWAGFPLTRMVDGTWVGRAPDLWITGGVWHRRQTEDLDPQTDRLLQAYFDRERAMFTEDLARKRPDVIVVDNRGGSPWAAWIETYPPLAAQMAHYHLHRSIENFDILRRDADP